ncbi:MAG: hypothetical protein AAF416_00435 [Pseudomonadota bacterium]
MRTEIALSARADPVAGLGLSSGRGEGGSVAERMSRKTLTIIAFAVILIAMIVLNENRPW